MLLNLSETLAQIGDWLSLHFAELGGVLSIPLVVGFLTKLILSFVKNKQVIKSAVLDSVKTLNGGINALKSEISLFKGEVQTQLADLERNMENKIDNKFEELKEKRKEIYNNIMAGVDKIETKTKEVVEKAEETINEVVEEIVQEMEQTPEIKETEINVYDILR